jgi:hypothetical protein
MTGPDARLQLATLSTWADDVRHERKETAPWHFVDIEVDGPGYDHDEDCAKGCAVDAIKYWSGVLADRSQPPATRREALRWVVHIVADLHQPLHAADNHDRGGNEVKLIYRGKPMNLHACWDGGCWEDTLNDDRSGRQFVAAITPDERRRWEKGTPEDWAAESWKLARADAYDLPADGLDDAYVTRLRGVVAVQLGRGGVRLAEVLNRALGK